jgi:hypothetical protein
MKLFIRLGAVALTLLLAAQSVAQEKTTQEKTAEIGAKGSLIEAYNQLLPEAKLAVGNTQVYVYNGSNWTFYGVCTLSDFTHLTLIASPLHPYDYVAKDLNRKARRVRLFYQRSPSGFPIPGPIAKAPPDQYVAGVYFWFDSNGAPNYYAWYEPL